MTTCCCCCCASWLTEIDVATGDSEPVVLVTGGADDEDADSIWMILEISATIRDSSCCCFEDWVVTGATSGATVDSSVSWRLYSEKYDEFCWSKFDSDSVAGAAVVVVVVVVVVVLGVG